MIKRQNIFVLGVALTAMACATDKPKPMPVMGPLVESQPQVQEVKTVVVGVPYAQPVPGQAVQMPPAAPSKEDIKKASSKPKPVHQVLDEANKLATRTIVPEGFMNAVQVYTYMEGALYSIKGAPNHLTAIEFGHGETIMAMASGDTVRWQVDKTTSGSGPTAREIVIIQPVQKGLHTTLIITTTVGTYRFNLQSYQHSYLTGVRFRYPRKRLLIMQRRIAAQAKARAKSKASKGLSINLNKLDSNYRFVLKGDAPSWAPVRVFNDGKRTFIEFKKPLAGKKAPALFVLSKSKKGQVVQHIIRGRYIIVPMTVQLAQLVVGKQSIGIEYKGRK